MIFFGKTARTDASSRERDKHYQPTAIGETGEKVIGPHTAHESTSKISDQQPERLMPNEDVFRQYRPALRRRAQALAANHAAAEDLVQDTLERAWRNRSSLGSKKSILAWMMTVLHNHFIDSLRVEKTEATKKASYLHVVVTEQAQENLVPQWLQISDAQLETAISSLPREYQDVLRCRIRGLCYDDMAQELRIPKTTIGTRLFRARKALKAALEARLEAEGEEGP